MTNENVSRAYRALAERAVKDGIPYQFKYYTSIVLNGAFLSACQSNFEPTLMYKRLAIIVNRHIAYKLGDWIPTTPLP